MQETSTTNNVEEVNLNNCDREPIHIPGSVQSFGALVSCNNEQVITRVSDNIGNWLQVSPQELIGKPISDYFNLEEIAEIMRLNDNSWRSKPLSVKGRESKLHAICHVNSTEIYFDLLHQCDQDVRTRYASTIADLSRAISGTTTEVSTAQLLADTVRKLSGFDRVKVYKFDEDWHGEVIAESRVDEVPSYLGLHFPQSDIPKQARELYKRNKVRVIGDIDDPQSKLIEQPGLKPLDMSFSFVRSVSPIHLQYLRNMLVSSSMSLSLMQNKKFWGLIACHHRTPRTFTFEEADMFEAISALGSNRLTDLYRINQAELKTDQHELIQEIIAELRQSKDVKTLVDGSFNVGSLIYSTGAVVVLDGKRVASRNAVPDESSVEMLVSWLERDGEDLIFYDDLPQRFGDIGSYACGMLAARIPDLPSAWIIWFRFEVTKEVSWAGDPFKPVDETKYGSRLYPRTSFELWKEIKKGHSLPWSQFEVESARSLVTSLSNSSTLETLRSHRFLGN